MKIEQITSRDNRRLVEARKVRDSKVNGKIFVEGRRLVEEALRSEVIIEQVFFADDFNDDALRNAFRGPVFEVSTKLFASLADTDNPQGIIVIARRPETGPKRLKHASGVPIVVSLNEVNNPSNLGAVIRTAEAAGVRGVIVSNDSADIFSPKALRAAMGSSFRVPVWENAAYEDNMRWAKKNSMATTAADISAERSYTSIDWKEPRLLIFGSEAHGLSASQLSMVDEVIKIPMAAGIESLNLAVSTGIILFEAKRQNEP